MNKQNKQSLALQAKKDLVGSLSPKLKSATSVVFVNYQGLSVTLQQKLKAELKAVGSDMTVVKNTLIKIAGKEAGLPEEALNDEILSGQTAIILTEGDAVAPIQALGKFVKENQIPNFKVGIVEGKYQDKEALLKISTLPSKETLYAQVVGSLSSPMYGLVGTLQGNLQKLVYILSQKAK
ncbi:MAG: 50S ribosomal protein L10 [bacterium]|nr:MAG: 50S ribosomal protein L10 [bacterium]